MECYYSGIAQLVEQVAVNHRVVGSSPTAGANMSLVLDESVTNGRWTWFDSKWWHTFFDEAVINLYCFAAQYLRWSSANEFF